MGYRQLVKVDLIFFPILMPKLFSTSFEPIVTAFKRDNRANGEF